MSPATRKNSKNKIAKPMTATVSLPFSKGGVERKTKPVTILGSTKQSGNIKSGGKTATLRRKPNKLQQFVQGLKNRFSDNSLKDKSGLKVKNGKNRKAPKALRNVIFALFAIAGVASLGFGAYYGIQKVIEIRAKSFSNKIDLNKKIIGYDDVPRYPGSEYIYEGLDDNELVQKTLNAGIAVYRVPYGHTTDEVFEFYTEYLPQFDWQFLQTAPLTSSDMMYGQYWVKGSKGLRIYSRLNDIWFETITDEEATTGLSARKAEIIEREQVLNQDELQALLPAYPWQLFVTGEYLIEYYTPDIEDTIGISFRHLITNQRTYLDPIGQTGKSPEDTQVEAYLEKYNLYLTQAVKNPSSNTALSEDSYHPWKVMNSFYTNKNGLDMLQVSVTNGPLSTTGYTLRNQIDGNTYFLISFDGDLTFTEYALENIKDKSGLTPDQTLKIYEE